MLTIINSPDHDTKEFVDFCASKFTWLYPVKLRFTKAGPQKMGGCWYLNTKRVVIGLDQVNKYFLLYTIVHELRHVEQGIN
jgi:hypothetical protein